MRLNGGKVRLQIGTQAQRADDIGKALPDLVQHGRKFLPGAGRVIAAVKKIGDLCIAVKAFARRGGDNIAAGRGFPDDRRDLFKLCGGRKRAAAEFHNDGIHGKLLSMGCWRYFRIKSPAASTMFSRKTAFSAKNLRAGEKHLSFCQERTKPPDKRPAAHDTVSFAKALVGAGLCSARWAGANLHSTL